MKSILAKFVYSLVTFIVAVCSNHVANFASLVNTIYSFIVTDFRNTVVVWHVLAQDKTLLTSIMDYLLDTLARSLPYEEKGGAGSSNDTPTRVATLVPLTVSPASVKCV